MGKRHHITMGSYTTAMGMVVAGAGTYTIDGKNLALEGDEIACPACGNTGRIICIGPRWPETFNGRQVALEGDLCACGCTPPPKLLASQSRKFQTIDGQGSASSAIAQSQLGAGHSQAIVAEAEHGQRFQFLDSETQQPMAERHYTGKINGKPVAGTTDSNGVAHVDAPAGATIELHLTFNSPKTALQHQED